MPHDDQVTVRCSIEHRTTNAILIRPELESEEELVWIPQSQVYEIHEQDGYIVVTRWIAEERGLM